MASIRLVLPFCDWLVYKYRLGLPSAPLHYGLTWPVGISTIFRPQWQSLNMHGPAFKAVQSGVWNIVYDSRGSSMFPLALRVWNRIHGISLPWRHMSVMVPQITGNSAYCLIDNWGNAKDTIAVSLMTSMKTTSKGPGITLTLWWVPLRIPWHNIIIQCGVCRRNAVWISDTVPIIICNAIKFG